MVWEREAPAKINLTLDILGRRPDGYHEMRMVMQTVSLCDTVQVEETAEGFRLESGLDLPEGKKTLEQQAAEAFFRTLGLPVPGLRVRLIKRTPAYAGMGGGSADVAALLRILRDHWCPNMTDAALEEIGLTVGSDVPFCLRGGTALAEGRGEVLTDLAPLPLCWIVVCKPDFGIPTPTLFARVDDAPIADRPDTDGMCEALAGGDLDGVASRLCNVFEAALPSEYDQVFAIKDKLLELGAMNAAMSGSGPTVFGLFRQEAAAQQAAQTLQQTYRETYCVCPVGKLQ